MKAQIVIGLGFGDEGKGITTDFLASKNPNSLVVRFSGGHQAGHTVHSLIGDKPVSHVFSQIGSGTFSGADTFYSRYCTFYPTAFLREYEAFVEKAGFNPVVYVDPLAPVTTVYDVAFNRVTERKNQHGSCGVGFAATVERHQMCKFHFQDLCFDLVSMSKHAMVREYYDIKTRAMGIGEVFDHEVARMGKSKDDFYLMSHYIRSGEKCAIKCMSEIDVFSLGHTNVIFEGSQGIMLDESYGFFPHVTRSSTTSKNALAICQRNGLSTPEIYYATRCYLTRHGHGPIPNQDDVAFVRDVTPEESNVTNEWQGNFKRGILDLEQLRYAITCDDLYSHACAKNIMVTCLDQISDFQAYEGKNLISLTETQQFIKKIGLPYNTPVFGSFSQFSTGVKKLGQRFKVQEPA